MTKADEPYNPLDKFNLAKSIRNEILSREPILLATDLKLSGAGVYAIYYVGDFAPYEKISAANLNSKFSMPIYVGKAIPKGGRKGGIIEKSGSGRSISERLGQHAKSIQEAQNINLSDFYFRHLVVDDIWIPLGENALITEFNPLWNAAIDGFGNKDPGRRRANQYKSPWDVLHPGRDFAEKLADSSLTSAFLQQRVDDFLNGRKLAKLPKIIAEALEDEQAELEEAADEA